MPSQWGGAATGALGGATTGGSIGSLFGPIGTGIGAGLGALGGGIAGFFGTQKDKIKKIPTKTPEQQRGLSQIFDNLNKLGGPEGSYGRAQNYLSSILQGGQQGYDQFSQPYLQQFEQQVIPHIAERFAGLGGGMGGGVGSSSGFGQALGGAGADFSAQLAQLYSGRQENAATQALGNYGNLAQIGLGQSPFENLYQQGSSLGEGIFEGSKDLIPVLMKYLLNKKGNQTGVTAGPYGGGDTYDPYSGMQGGELLG